MPKMIPPVAHPIIIAVVAQPPHSRMIALSVPGPRISRNAGSRERLKIRWSMQSKSQPAEAMAMTSQ